MKTKTLLCLSVFALTLLPSAKLNADTIDFTATLSGANETPPHETGAAGTGMFAFDTVAQNITYSISYSGLSSPSTMAHVHFGASGVAGPIILPDMAGPFGTTSGTLTGVWTAADLTNQDKSGISTFMQIYDAALANQLYANVHSADFPAGEIRGQLVQASVPEPSSMLLLAAGLLAVPALLRKRQNGAR